MTQQLKNIKFNGSPKQNKWAASILEKSNLTNKQIDNLLRYAGPTMYAQSIMDVTLIIENRHNLAVYSDSLGAFYNLSKEDKHTVANDAINLINRVIVTHTNPIT